MLYHRRFEFLVLALLLICAWVLFDTKFGVIKDDSVDYSIIEKPWRYEAPDADEEQTSRGREPARGGTNEEITSTATSTSISTWTTSQHASTPGKTPVTTSTSTTLPDRVVVMAKTPTEDTQWVHTDLQDWQSAIYDIDTETPHNMSTLDPLTNNTLRTLRNKGREANAYLAYIVQNYDSLPSTIAFVHPHKDGYPAAWHTDNEHHSNALSLQSLNIDFVQSNGYANLRCIHVPGCPDEVRPFRDPPEEHRTSEAAMPAAWQDLFGNTNIPEVLATPCCAQFAVSSKQVRKRPLEEYKQYYTWLMETSLDDDTSGRVFEYLWHVLFGQDPV